MNVMPEIPVTATDKRIFLEKSILENWEKFYTSNQILMLAHPRHTTLTVEILKYKLILKNRTWSTSKMEYCKNRNLLRIEGKHPYLSTCLWHCGINPLGNTTSNLGLKSIKDTKYKASVFLYHSTH